MDWKKTLKQLKYEYLKKTSPGFFEASGGYTMRLPAYSDDTVNGLKHAVLDFIKFMGGTASELKSSCQVRKERVELALGNYRNLVKVSHLTPVIKALIAGQMVIISVKGNSSTLSQEDYKDADLLYNAKDFPSFFTFYTQVFENVLLQVPA